KFSVTIDCITHSFASIAGPQLAEPVGRAQLLAHLALQRRHVRIERGSELRKNFGGHRHHFAPRGPRPRRKMSSCWPPFGTSPTSCSTPWPSPARKRSSLS